MDKRTKICLWVIILGLINFLAYAIIYMYLGGEAVSGWVVDLGRAAGTHRYQYYLQAHPGIVVSKAVFIYSGIHSISIWPTVAAVWLALLTLAKERIVSAMHSTIVRGRTFFTILATIIAFTCIVITIWFILHFIDKLNKPYPEPGLGPTTPPAALTSAPARPPG